MLQLPIEHWLVILSVFISLAGACAYIRDTLAGKTKPNRITWSMWAATPLIATGAAIHADADFWATARVFIAGLTPLLVFLASFVNKQSYWKLTPFDFTCGIFSALAIITWLAMGSPRSAILLAACGNGIAGLPTIVKVWKYPETETGIAFLASLISVLLVIPSIPVWNIENSAFQVMLIGENLLLVTGAYRKRKFRMI